MTVPTIRPIPLISETFFFKAIFAGSPLFSSAGKKGSFVLSKEFDWSRLSLDTDSFASFSPTSPFTTGIGGMVDQKAQNNKKVSPYTLSWELLYLCRSAREYSKSKHCMNSKTWKSAVFHGLWLQNICLIGFKNNRDKGVQSNLS